MTDTEIVNAAFDEIGEDPIASLDDTSEQAKLAKRNFWMNADQMLVESLWRFATVRTGALAPDPIAPAFEWANRFALPTDPFCLRVITTNLGPREPYSIEGRFLLSNQGSVKLIYVGRILDINLWHPLFVSALTFRLAARFARAITESGDIVKEKYGLYADECRKARGVNAMEASVEYISSEALTAVRRSSD